MPRKKTCSAVSSSSIKGINNPGYLKPKASIIKLNKKKISSYAKAIDNSIEADNLSEDEIYALVKEARNSKHLQH